MASSFLAAAVSRMIRISDSASTTACASVSSDFCAPAAKSGRLSARLWPALLPFLFLLGCVPAPKEKRTLPPIAVRFDPPFVLHLGLPESYPVPFYHHALI